MCIETRDQQHKKGRPGDVWWDEKGRRHTKKRSSSAFKLSHLILYAHLSHKDLLTLRKSISWVINVPSVLWNSSIIMSSWIFDVIVSCTTSPPCNKEINFRNIYFSHEQWKTKKKIAKAHPQGRDEKEVKELLVSLSKWYGVNNGNMNTKPLNYVSLPHFMLAARECSWERNSRSFCMHAHTHTHSRAFLIPLYHHFCEIQMDFPMNISICNSRTLWHDFEEKNNPPSNPIIDDIRAPLSIYTSCTQWGKYVCEANCERKEIKSWAI